MSPSQVTCTISYIINMSRVDHFLTLAPCVTELMRDMTLNWFSWYCWEFLYKRGIRGKEREKHLVAPDEDEALKMLLFYLFIYFFWRVYLMCVLMCAARQRSVCLCERRMCFFLLSAELSIIQPHSSPANPVVRVAGWGHSHTFCGPQPPS